MGRTGITRIVAIIASGVLGISGCSYHYSQAFEGYFVESGRQIVGYVESGFAYSGSFGLGTLERQECEGNFEVSKVGKTLFGIRLTNTVLDGHIACLDGRFGNVHLVSQGQGRSGQMSEVGGEAFQATMIVGDGNCFDGHCGSGPHWTYENDMKDAEIYCKVWAAHGLHSPTSLCMKVGN